MNQNYLKKYLDIVVLNDKTVIKYWNDDVLSFTHEHNVGLNHIEKELVNELIMSDWLNGLSHALNIISLQDRVPTFIYLTTEKYGNVFEKTVRNKNTYSQFFIENNDLWKGVRVIIKKINYANINSLNADFNLPKNLKENSNNNSKSYERYTKTISQFKF
ncbi:MAG: hypothetical protein WCO35_00940 [Candidatus Nomurabacteria bacterium]